MFGFFEKKAIDNNKFNSMVIATLGEITKTLNRIPTEDELYKFLHILLNQSKINISQSQLDAVQKCAIYLQSGFGDELLPLLRQLNLEIPKGERASYDKIFGLMQRRGILFDEHALDFLKKYQ